MLILPIKNNNRILNVEVKLKNAKKVRENIYFDDTDSSDVIVNGRSFNSVKEKGDDEVLDFIRNTSINYKRDFLVTTSLNNNKYDVYQLNQPPRHINNTCDDLYIKTINSLKYENKTKDVGKYVTLEKLGFDNIFSDNKLRVLENIVSAEKDRTKWPELFKRVGIYDIVETIDFLREFDFTSVKGATMSEEEINDILRVFNNINTKDTKSINNYVKMAETNRLIYTKISKANKLLYGKSIGLIKSVNQKQKQLVKKAA